MGRRKIEIKAIKDDRNRSVTFLKRKGGLFKKAHELSVLCSVDVAVFIFGNNKKLYEYSSTDMRELVQRYQMHGTINEHKGPADFNGGNDDDDDDDADGSPPRGSDGVQMMPPQFGPGQHPPFSQILRHNAPSASPPIAHGVPYQPHHVAQPHPRGATPQPVMGPRPSSSNDVRRVGPGMPPHPVPGPHASHPASHSASHPGITYIPTPPIYNPPGGQPSIVPQHGGQYSYPPQSQQPYVEDRRPSAPPTYATQHPPPPPPPPPQAAAAVARTEPSPPLPSAQKHVPPHSAAQASVSSSQPGRERRPQDSQPPAPVEPKTETPSEWPPVHADTAIKKMPQRKSHSIFTPIEENRSILYLHAASFATDPQAVKGETGPSATSAPPPPPPPKRSPSADAPSGDGAPTSPQLKRSSTQSSLDKSQNPPASAASETAAPTPPSRSNSNVGGPPAGASRSRGPRLTVQIPDGESEPGSATGESNSPNNPAMTPTQAPQRSSSHSSVVLPPPSPSASALLSAGATGPPNPFARPPPQQNVNGDTPASALPSRFLNEQLLPSPSSFYPDWNFRSSDSNTLPSPLNFATPVVGSGPSFLRDDGHPVGSSSAVTSGHAASHLSSGLGKRKSPDFGIGGHGDGHAVPSEPKRVKVEYA
ncbi:hypothetical protein XA68_13910 [Ophiocordyceps unilateralis]|uniref:MADS-box MEF2 type transcription factor MIG1 n=1 Tax=Ophiocordyceps unilateralis TaxID=268505 RepID=A0A2A9PAQ5_OPHUN|nr:hypothetical protein XA68_13910 [Ophiocordyceps unilateralis]